MEQTDLPKIGAPATRALAGAGITKLHECSEYSEEYLLQLHGVGSKAIRILKEELAKKGLSFKNSEQ